MYETTSIDRAARSAGPEMIDLIEGVADWAVALKGGLPIKTGLGRLRKAFGAEAAVLSRVSATDGTPSGLIIDDKETGSGRGIRIERSFANAVLGRYLLKPRVGSLWFSDQMNVDDCPEFRRVQTARSLRELVIIVLQVDARAVTFLEIHFRHRLAVEGRGALNSLAGTLLGMWEKRQPGTFSEFLLARPSSSGTAPKPEKDTAPLLSTKNPAQLSRAEFRVCTLLSTGLSASRTREEMGISDSTLRSHLRQIYIKTSCTGMAELLYELLSRPAVVADAVLPGSLRHSA